MTAIRPAPLGECDEVLRAGDRERGLDRVRRRPSVRDDAVEKADVGGGGPAAPADKVHSCVHECARRVRIGLGSDIVDSGVPLDMGEPGVRLNEERFGGHGAHALRKREQLGGTERAVDADGIGAEGVEGHRGDLGARSQKRAPVLPKRHGHDDGQVGVLAAGEVGRLCLGEVGHGLDDEEVGARSRGGARLLGKKIVCLVERERAERAKERPGGPYVRGDVAGARGACAGDGGGKDIVYGGGPGELQAVRAEGVGGHYVAARLHVRAMHGGDGVGVREAPELGHLSCNKARSLQHRSHAAVKQEMRVPCEGVGQGAFHKGILSACRYTSA